MTAIKHKSCKLMYPPVLVLSNNVRISRVVTIFPCSRETGVLIYFNKTHIRKERFCNLRLQGLLKGPGIHYNDVIMSAMTSQITSLKIVYSTVYSGANQRKYQISASLAFVWGIHRSPVNSPHRGPVTRKMFPFDDVIVYSWKTLKTSFTVSNE